MSLSIYAKIVPWLANFDIESILEYIINYFFIISGGHKLPRTPNFVEPEVHSPYKVQKNSLYQSSSIGAQCDAIVTSPLLQTNKKNMISGGNKLPRTSDFDESSPVKPVAHSPPRDLKKSMNQSSSIRAQCESIGTSPLLQMNKTSLIGKSNL